MIMTFMLWFPLIFCFCILPAVFFHLKHPGFFTVKQKILISGSFCPVIFFYSAFFYGTVRTMSGTFGFSLETSLSSIIATLIFVLPVIVFALILFPMFFGKRKGTGWIILISGLLFSGMSAMEIGILYDEYLFAGEVRQLNIPAGETYSRQRAWPNRNSDMICDPENGFSSTD